MTKPVTFDSLFYTSCLLFNNLKQKGFKKADSPVMDIKDVERLDRTLVNSNAVHGSNNQYTICLCVLITIKQVSMYECH